MVDQAVYGQQHRADPPAGVPVTVRRSGAGGGARLAGDEACLVGSWTISAPDFYKDQSSGRLTYTFNADHTARMDLDVSQTVTGGGPVANVVIRITGYVTSTWKVSQPGSLAPAVTDVQLRYTVNGKNQGEMPGMSCRPDPGLPGQGTDAALHLRAAQAGAAPPGARQSDVEARLNLGGSWSSHHDRAATCNSPNTGRTRVDDHGALFDNSSAP